MSFEVVRWLNRLFYYSLLLVAFLLPVHSRFTGIFIAIALFSWLAANRFQFSFQYRKKSVATILISLYLCYLLGVTYSLNQTEAWHQVLLRITLFIFPLLFFSDSVLELPDSSDAAKWFVAGGLLTSLLLLAHAAFVFFFDNTSIFYSSNMTAFMHITPAYLSMYFVFMNVFLLHSILNHKMRLLHSIINLVLIALFTLMILLLSVRTEMLALLVAFVLQVMRHFLSQNKLWQGIAAALLIGIVLIGISWILPFSRARIVETEQQWNKAYSNDNPTSITERKVIWQTAAELIMHRPLIGVGTGDVQDDLYDAYRANNLKWPLEDKLNAHNQFLQTSLALGVIGFVALVLLFGCGLKLSIAALHDVYFLFLLTFILSSITESMFETESGVVFFGLFNSLMANECLSLRPT